MGSRFNLVLRKKKKENCKTLLVIIKLLQKYVRLEYGSHICVFPKFKVHIAKKKREAVKRILFVPYNDTSLSSFSSISWR